MSEDQLAELTTNSFTELGGSNYVQARILYELKTFLLRRPNRKMVCMNSDVKERRSKAWIYAYTLAFEFIRNYNMETTLQTINVEKMGKRVKTDTSFLGNLSPSMYLIKLLKGRRRKIRFKKHYTNREERNSPI